LVHFADLKSDISLGPRNATSSSMHAAKKSLVDQALAIMHYHLC